MTPDELKAARAELGLSVPQLAARLGVHRDAVYKWERGADHPQGRAIPPPVAILLRTWLHWPETRP